MTSAGTRHPTTAQSEGAKQSVSELKLFECLHDPAKGAVPTRKADWHSGARMIMPPQSVPQGAIEVSNFSQTQFDEELIVTW